MLIFLLLLSASLSHGFTNFFVFSSCTFILSIILPSLFSCWKNLITIHNNIILCDFWHVWCLKSFTVKVHAVSLVTFVVILISLIICVISEINLLCEFLVSLIFWILQHFSFFVSVKAWHLLCCSIVINKSNVIISNVHTGNQGILAHDFIATKEKQRLIAVTENHKCRIIRKTKCFVSLKIFLWKSLHIFGDFSMIFLVHKNQRNDKQEINVGIWWFIPGMIWLN